MPLWLAIYLPDLPLEAAWPRRTRLALPATLAVGQQGRILQATPAAQQGGVQAGLTVAAAQAMVPTLLVSERQLALEQEHQQAVALCLQAYSSQVALPAAQWVVLEVGASLRLFGGPLALSRRVRASLASLALSWCWGLAPSARGAVLLAQSMAEEKLKGRRCRVLQVGTLRRSLDVLPWRLLSASQPHADWLQSLGLRTVGDLRRLPRAQLQLRTRTELLRELDQAYGLQTWPLAWWQAPARFSLRHEFDEALEHNHEVLQPATILIEQLSAWLRSRNEMLDSIKLQLLHESSRHALAPTVLVLSVSQATAQAQPWLRVMAEQLPRQTLPAPVRGLWLQAGPAQPQATASHSLFHDQAQEALMPLLDLMRARLGPQGVLQAAVRPSFLPEQANHWAPATVNLSSARAFAPLVALWPRPVWLLEAPQALVTLDGRPSWQGRLLHLRLGPERLETAWWQGGIQARDYFVADDGHGAWCWIYRARGNKAAASQLHGQASGSEPAQLEWWLHGWFG